MAQEPPASVQPTNEQIHSSPLIIPYASPADYSTGQLNSTPDEWSHAKWSHIGMLSPRNLTEHMDTPSHAAPIESNMQEEGHADGQPRSLRKRSSVRRFEAGSATDDNKKKRISVDSELYYSAPNNAHTSDDSADAHLSYGTSPTCSSSLDDSSADRMSHPSTSDQWLPGSNPQTPSKRRTSVTRIMSPVSLARDGMWGETWDSEQGSEGDAESHREREVILPTELPAVGERAADEFVKGSTLLWKPSNIAEDVIDDFLKNARHKMDSGGNKLHTSEDVLLTRLMQNDYNITAVFEEIQDQSIGVNVTGLGPAFNMWTEKEASTFETEYISRGKKFAAISQALEHRTVSDCVSFYYKWKKTARGTAARLSRKRMAHQPLHFTPLKQVFIPMPDAFRQSDSHPERSTESSDDTTLEKVTKKKRPVSRKEFKSRSKRRKLVNQKPQKARSSRAQKSSARNRKNKTAGIFTVEAILESRINRGKREFRVKWQDYPMADCTWEPESNLEHNIVLQAYLSKKKLEDR